MYCHKHSGELKIYFFKNKNKHCLHAWTHSYIRVGVFVNLYKTSALKENVKFYGFLSLHISVIISNRYLKNKNNKDKNKHIGAQLISYSQNQHADKQNNNMLWWHDQ